MPREGPILRNKNLQVLSHEHHHGLVFCLRLKQGINITPLEILQSYVKDFWEKDLSTHFCDEEELLLPHLSLNTELSTRMMTDHQNIRRIINELISDTSPSFSKILELSFTLESHIRFEEQELFAYLEKILSEEILITIGLKLNGKEVSKHTFSPEFWHFN